MTTLLCILVRVHIKHLLNSYFINTDFALIQSHETTSTIDNDLKTYGSNFNLLLLHSVIEKPKMLKYELDLCWMNQQLNVDKIFNPEIYVLTLAEH